MAETKTIRLGTRGSALARWQADWVTSQLEARGVVVEQVLIKTTGDVRSGPIAKLPERGVFTKEIQRALLDGKVDLAVHSLKDLPTEPVPGLSVAAVPERAPVGDALLTNEAKSWQELSNDARVATGSLRRRAQLLSARPTLTLVDVRGNVDTRLRKLHEGEFDALVLAEAGLVRLQLEHHIAEIFDKRLMLPAVGQGALGLEVRTDDQDTRTAVSFLDDPPTHAAVVAERTLLADLRGGCLAPVGAWARQLDERLVMDAVVLSVDGQQRLAVHQEGDLHNPAQIGSAAAEALLSEGAAELIASIRDHSD